jgi:PAS domain S-box-containing protein
MLTAETSWVDGRPLRLLLVEDTDDDAALVVRALRQAGFDFSVRCVQTAEDFVTGLVPSPDLVISDHSLPSFSSTAALACLRERDLDVPFIVVSGTIDEESAVALLRGGAHDFVTKQNLARLGPAIRRELQEARHRAERRDAQTQLQVQRDFLRLVIDSNPAMIFAKDWEGRYTLANQATADVYGTTPGALVGKTDWDVNPNTAEADHFREADRAVMTSGQAVPIARESVTDTRTGRLRWFEMRRMPLVVPNSPPQVLSIGIDITERVAAEEALRASEEQFRQAQKMEAVGQLAGGIAHDFNNLLTMILGYSDLVLDHVRDRPEVAQDVEEIRRAGKRATGLTRQLLAFSRKQVLQPQLLDLNQVVGEAAKMLRRLIGEEVRLRTISAPGLRRVTADPGQIEQVLMNLAINARDAMPTGGTLTIQLANATTPPQLRDLHPATTDTCVALSVTDTGLGMTPDVQKRIFEPFFSTKSPSHGTGLGLSMVYGVVTQSGGSISVESEPDRGTRFVIYLPVAVEEQQLSAGTAPPSEQFRGAETILLVDDERAIRELVRKVLNGYGYHVLEATDTSDAMRVAASHSGAIHLLLSDMVMPGMSGPELAQQLLRLRSDMRFLYMSGLGDNLSTGAGSASAPVAVLHKPFTPEMLVTKVRESLNDPGHALTRKVGD